MRTDVKIGLVLSLVLVVAAGWYYLGRGADEGTAVPLTEESAGADQPALADAAEHVPAVVRRSDDRPPILPPPEDDEDMPVEEPSASEAGPFDNLLAAAEGRDEGPPTGLLAGSTDRDDSAKATAEPPTEQPETAAPTDATGDARDRRSRLIGRRGQASPRFSRRQGGAQPPAAETETQPPPAKPEPGTRTHVVGHGDTLAILAEVYYGSQRYTDFLHRANPQVTDPRNLMVGTVLNIPPLSPGHRAEAVPPTGTATLTAAETDRTYRVQSGDSFYAIARDVLGDANRWKELLELNSTLVDGDPLKLRPGQVLRLPASGPAADK